MCRGGSTSSMTATSISMSPMRTQILFPFWEKEVPGANHCAICAGSVTACQTRSHGAAIQILRSIVIFLISFALCPGMVHQQEKEKGVSTLRTFFHKTLKIFCVLACL